MANFEISNLIGWISSVIGLAPTSIKKEEGFAGSLLILQGSHDGDTPAGGGSIGPYEQSLFLDKYFCWIHGGNHSGFLTLANPVSDNISFPPNLAIFIHTQRLITWNYVTAFLRWKMNGDSQFRPLFVGDGHFAFVQDANFQTQDDIKENRLRVLPRYDVFAPMKLAQESSFVFKGILQKGVLISPQNPVKTDALQALNALAIPQSTLGIIVEWDKTQHKISTVMVPFLAAIMQNNPKFIEFQAVIVSTSAPQSGVLIPLTLLRKVNNMVVQTPPVFVNIPTPVVINSLKKNSPFTRSMLTTIRVPISAWGIFPAPSVYALLMNLGSASIPSAAIALSGFRGSLQ